MWLGGAFFKKKKKKPRRHRVPAFFPPGASTLSLHTRTPRGHAAGATGPGHGPPPAVRAFLSFFFSSRRRHTRLQGDWSSDVCSSDLTPPAFARISGSTKIPFSAR